MSSTDLPPSEDPKAFVRDKKSIYERFLNRKCDSVFVHPFCEEGFANFIDVNDFACFKYGYSREEFMMLSPPDLTNKEDVALHRARSFRNRLLVEGQLVFRTEHIRKNGHRFPVEIDAMVIEHEGQSVILSVVRDISEQVNSELQLRESEARYRTLFEQGGDEIFIANMYGDILEFNEQFCSNLGYSRDELKRMKLTDVEPFHLEKGMRGMWDMIPFNQPLTIRRHRIRRDKTSYPVEVRLTRSEIKGEKVILGFARDISDRVEQSQELEASRIRFRTLVENVPSLAIQGYYGDGTVFFWNKANEDIYGYTAAEAIGKNLVDLIIPDEMKDPVRGVIAHAGKTGEFPDASELSLLHKDGSRVSVFSSHASVKVGDQYELYCLDYNLREIKAAQQGKEHALEKLIAAKEAAEQASRAKDEFLAVMSHEMRTPLNPIVGFTSMMVDSCSPEHRRFHEIIMKSSKRLLALIEHVLDFSRLERGESKYTPRSIDILDLCHNALNNTRSRSKRLEVEFANGFNDYEPVTLRLMGDPNMLIRLFENLLSNAFKYTKEGFVRVEIGGQLVSDSVLKFVFSVTDSGIGIDDSIREKLFQPFTQADSSYSRSFDGVGLGLAVCRKLVEIMDGGIFVESESGKGSRFWVEIPLAVDLSHDSDDAGENDSSVELNDDYLILVAEDNQDGADLVESIINQSGGRCVVAKNGEEATHLCQETAFDLILMDLSMPDVDGFEASRRIRNKGLNQETPIMATTAHASNAVKKRCLDFGMASYLSKPFRHVELIREINQLMVRD